MSSVGRDNPIVWIDLASVRLLSTLNARSAGNRSLRSSNALLGCIVIWFQASAPALMAQAPHAARTCAPRAWSPPRLLDEGADSPFEITKPWLASTTGGDLYVVGRGPVIESSSGPYLHVPFVALVLHPDGSTTRLASPPFAGEFYAPRVVVARDGPHVFWGEPDSTDAPPPRRSKYRDYLPVIRGIWTSAYQGGVWTPPKLARAPVNTSWLFSTGSAPPNYSPGVSIAFTNVSAAGWSIDWLGLHNSWSRNPGVTLETPPLYTALASTTPFHLVLGYIADDPSMEGDKSSVWAVHSADGGRKWSAPARIAGSGGHPASDLAVVRTSDGLLHAVWARNTSGQTFGSQVIGYSFSRDEGQNWSPPEYWSAKETFLNLKAVADAHGRVHVVYQTTLADGLWPTLVYTSRTRTTQWSAPVRLFGDKLSVRAPALAKISSGDLVLLFSERIGVNDRFPIFASAVSFLRDTEACTPSP